MRHHLSDFIAKLDLPWETVSPCGNHIVKVDAERIDQIGRPDKGRVVLVTAMIPTPAGEGKTTTLTCTMATSHD